MKLSIKGFLLPTPAKARQIANAVGGVCLGIAGASIINNYPHLCIAFTVVGYAAHGISDLFVGDQKDVNSDIQRD